MFLFLDSLMRAAKIMKLAIKQISTHRLAPTPLNYSLCYAYHSGKHPDLAKEIDLAFDIHGKLDLETAQSIYKEYLSDLKSQEKMKGIQEDTDTQMQKIRMETEDLCLNIDSFKTVLSEAIDSIDSPDEISIHPFVHALSEKTENFETVVENYRSELSKCHDTIKVLQLENKKLQDDSKKDPLTGLFNRRIFDLTLSQASYSIAIPISICFFDIDNFKGINDKFGHSVGDQVIKTVAKTILDEVPTNTTTVRMGGEEFAMIFHGLSPATVSSVNEKILKKIEKTRFNQRNGDQSFSVTVSMGQTTLTLEDTKNSFFQRADQLLHDAKKTGKNKLVIG